MNFGIEKGFAQMQTIVGSISRLGGRMIAACIAAFIAALLIFAAPEVGVAGAIGGIVMGGISALLIHPHSNV